MAVKILFVLSLTIALAASKPYKRYNHKLIPYSNDLVAAQDKPGELIIHHEYHGPGAPLSKDGRVLDTPEVAEAKKNHLAIYAETVAELVRKMLEAKNELEADLVMKELVEAVIAKKEQEAAAEAAAKAATTSAPIVVVEEVAKEQPVVEEALKKEAAPEADTKPVVEVATGNEVEQVPEVIAVPQPVYEGPTAPLNEDGIVVDTPEVAKVKANHMQILEEAVKKAAQEEQQQRDEKTYYDHPHKIIYLTPLHILYTHQAPVGYKGPLAPLGHDGRVIDTPEIQKAKIIHHVAHEHAKYLAARHPPKPEDDNQL